MGKRAILIVNPASGAIDNQTELVKQICLQVTSHAITVWYTTGEGDESKIRDLLHQSKYDLIMVAGGDGTIKLVASQMDGQQTPLLPIPFGSANGLCSCLGIEVWEDSIKALSFGNTIQMDVLDVDGELCLHVCDFGFNAGLIKKFEEGDERGMMGYFKSSLSQIFENNKYSFTLTLDGEETQFDAKMLVIANGDRYGTGAKINPTGKMDDGKFEVIVLNPDSVKEWTKLTIGLVRGDFSGLDFIKTFSTQKVIIQNQDAEFHIDGEIKSHQKNVAINLSKIKIEVFTNFSS